MTTTVEPSAPYEHLGLFSLPVFHQLTLTEGHERLQLDYYDDGRLVGSLVGVVTGDEFRSGFSSPFGGVDLVRDPETPARINGLVATVCSELERLGLRWIRIDARAPFYSHSESEMQFALLAQGFEIRGVELNHHLDLAGLRDAGDYVARLDWRVGQRALRRASALGLEFREATDLEQRGAAYDVLKSNRLAKGRPMRLSLDYLERLRVALPGRIRFFSLVAKGRACAAAITYLVRPHRWYVVYWGDAGHDLTQSPMNLLAFSLVEAALAEKVAVIDLGISSVRGELNSGLAQFKESVGAEATLRFEFIRRLGSHD